MNASSASPDTLQLLLASEALEPLLPTGLPLGAASNAPRPDRISRTAETPHLDRPDANPNDLPAQRWGVIAPRGPEGDALLDAVAPLIERRAAQQGAEVKRYRVDPDLDSRKSVEWRDTEYKTEDVPQEERPRYLLILGDLHQVSLDLQQVLAHGAFVGRLYASNAEGAPDLAGISAYAAKALRADEAASAGPPAALLYCAADGTPATTQGRALLVEPAAREVDTRWIPGGLVSARASVPDTAPRLQGLRDTAAALRSGVMLSVAHGVGSSRAKASAAQQRARQGALCLGPGQVLGPDELRTGAFLPGGMWLSVACFGAATPARSAYHAWIAGLVKQGLYPGRADEVLSCLPGPGERPFLSATAQAALANPEGPLALIGHGDLAWTFGFSDAKHPSRSRASRLLSALEALARGGRAGVALDALMRAYREANDDLTSAYQDREDALLEGRPDPIEPAWHGQQWMLRNDLRGYLLLGDPAARLPPRAAK